MNQAVATTSWGEQVARMLLDSKSCPVCALSLLTDGCCRRCGADLRGPAGEELWRASTAAADAMRARESLLLGVPRVAVDSLAAPAAAPAPGRREAPAAPPAPLDAARSSVAAARPRGSATLQSVLATAGAGLFAVAAIVFTYFNPDLADRGLRAVVIGIVTVLFLSGAWLLARRGLRFSAEAVGALGLVFAGLDVHAAAQLSARAIEPWLTAAGATAAIALAVLVFALRSGIRVWVWASTLAIAVVPAMVGYSSAGALSAALGHVGVAFAGAAVVETLPLLRRLRAGAETGSSALRTERVSLTVLQLLASLSALPLVARTEAPSPAVFTAALSAILALVAVHAIVASRHLLGRIWSFGAGAAGVAAITAGVYALLWPVVDEQGWAQAVIPTTAAISLVLVAGLLPLPARTSRGFVAGGGLTALGVAALVPLSVAGFTGAVTVVGFLRVAPEEMAEVSGTTWGWAVVLGIAGMSVGLGLFGVVARRRAALRALSGATDVAAASLAMISLLVLGCAHLLPHAASALLLAGGALLVGLTLRLLPRAVRRVSLRVALLIGAHLAVVTSMMVSWREPPSAPLLGLATLAALAAVSAAGAAALRFLHVGAGFGYVLILLATALGQAGVGEVAQLSLTASAGLALAIAATYLPRIGAREWRTVLVVAVVPFILGVLQVVFERSGWTALSTGLMFALAMSLLLTRRPGLTIVVRTAAAGMLVPALAVVIVCLGAQLLASSASPVTLPMIAVLVGLALPSTTLVRDALVRHGLGARTAGAARIAIEASALLTGAIATGLAVVRDAAGLGTTFLVLLLLGIGAVASALLTGRRYAWWVAGVAFTGALWSMWGLLGVDLLEAHLLPPTLGAAVVAAFLTLRGRRATGLYAAGLGLAIAPLLVVLGAAEPTAADAGAPWRTAGLLLAACGLLGLGTLLGADLARRPRLRRLRRLRTATLAAAGLAALAGAIQGVRLGLGLDLPWLHGAALFTACLGVSAVSSLVLACVGRGIRNASPAGARRRTSRWLEAPAVLVLAAGTWTAIERDWFSIWAMWMLMLGLLVMMLVIARRGAGATMPPVWFVFALAFVTAVVAWSPRDLRVEWFSLPLGAFLLLAGVIAMRAGAGQEGSAGERPTPDSWPSRWSGSWALLAPGVVTMMSASIVATFTDPLTWRAILVMVLALAAILVGSGRRLAAPFLLGLIVLPIENVFVFAVQIGRGVESMPWWITLAVIGAVLLIIAVTSERRTGAGASVAARVGDLR